MIINIKHINYIGTALLSYLGGILMRSDESGYDDYLITYVIIFFFSFIIAIVILLYDRKLGGIIDSNYPQRYLDYIEQRRIKKEN